MPTELHLALQQHYAGPDGEIEVRLDGFKADVIVGGLVYEIQTASFSSIRRKLEKLVGKYEVVLVHPIAVQKIIVHVDPESGAEIRSRRSPRRGGPADVYKELPYLAGLLGRPGLSLELVMTVQREVRCDDGKGSWRARGVSVVARELIEVLGARRFTTPADYLGLLPAGLPEPFTVSELAQAAGTGRFLAGKAAYALRHIGALEQVGKRGNAYLYSRDHEDHQHH